jgi:hypothetical protein
MRGRGDLLSIANDQDRRVRTLVPGKAFLAFQRDRVLVEIRALARITPAFGQLLAARDPDEISEAFMREASALMLVALGGVFNEPTAIINIFADHDCGLLLLYDLIEDPGALMSRPFKISVSRLSRRFGVSRVHILELLADPAARGLLDWRPDTRELTFSPTLAHAVRYCFGGVFITLAHHVARAEGAWAETAAA